jgi:hypothetical protein
LVLAAYRSSGEAQRGFAVALLRTRRQRVVAAELGVEEINGGAELPWRRTPSKFRRARA